MKTNRRKHIRWRKWDYGANGAYFVTICTKDRYPYFGTVRDDMLDFSIKHKKAYSNSKKSQNLKNSINLTNLQSYLIPNLAGKIADKFWKEIPLHYPFVRTDAFVLMPNHLHGILIFEKECKNDWITNRYGPQKDNLAVVLGSYKSSVTRETRKLGHDFAWQRKYHDRVLRNEQEYQGSKTYIWNNPSNWLMDEFYT